MGIEITQLHFLMSSQKAGVSLKKSVMLGRQDLLLRPSEIKNIFNQYNMSVDSEEIEHILNDENHFAEPLFVKLGAEVIDSIDCMPFEGATIVHDMNLPLPEKLKNSYSLVFDGGTLEHVFNFPQSIKNCMEMVKVDGHFMSVTPCNNMMGMVFINLAQSSFFEYFVKRTALLLRVCLLTRGGDLVLGFE